VKTNRSLGWMVFALTTAALVFAACAENENRCGPDTETDQSGLETDDGGTDGGGSVEPIKVCDLASECDDHNPCTVDVCNESICANLAHADELGCLLDSGDYGTCVWDFCAARTCSGQPDMTLCVAFAAPGVCVDGACHKSCQVNQGCDDDVLCTADYCTNGGYCMNNDSCSSGICDTTTGMCDSP
jgi:hypothetical protein